MLVEIFARVRPNLWATKEVVGVPTAHLGGALIHAHVPVEQRLAACFQQVLKRCGSAF